MSSIISTFLLSFAYKSLSSGTAPQSSSLSVTLDASRFMNHWIKPIGSLNFYSVQFYGFCFLTKWMWFFLVAIIKITVFVGFVSVIGIRIYLSISIFINMWLRHSMLIPILQLKIVPKAIFTWILSLSHFYFVPSSFFPYISLFILRFCCILNALYWWWFSILALVFSSFTFYPLWSPNISQTYKEPSHNRMRIQMLSYPPLCFILANISYTLQGDICCS